MTKKQKYNTEDNRGVAIYARKSRITNKGDSIGVQFKQCAEYAKRELHLDDEYSFLEYEDKGLSGYYSDRPDFQRMLHDIEMGGSQHLPHRPRNRLQGRERVFQNSFMIQCQRITMQTLPKRRYFIAFMKNACLYYYGRRWRCT